MQLNKKIYIALSLAFLIGSNYYTYKYTKEIFQEEGYFSGYMDEREKIMNKLLEVAPNMPYCNHEKLTEKNLIITHQTKGIYYTYSKENIVLFCQSQ